jgi:hypothetical protein
MKKTMTAWSLGGVAMLCLAACASTPPPTDQLAQAETAIKRAEEARVADYASPDLKNARDKLAAARDAVNREDMVLASRLAEQSRIDAEVAAAKAEASKAKSTITEMQKANAAIEQETQRNNSTAPAMPLPPPPPQPTR